MNDETNEGRDRKTPMSDPLPRYSMDEESTGFIDAPRSSSKPPRSSTTSQPAFVEMTMTLPAEPPPPPPTRSWLLWTVVAVTLISAAGAAFYLIRG